MCTVLLPPGVQPIAVNKYIISYHKSLSRPAIITTVVTLKYRGSLKWVLNQTKEVTFLQKVAVVCLVKKIPSFWNAYLHSRDNLSWNKLFYSTNSYTVFNVLLTVHRSNVINTTNLIHTLLSRSHSLSFGFKVTTCFGHHLAIFRRHYTNAAFVSVVSGCSCGLTRDEERLWCVLHCLYSHNL
jgi:hypothetical protein